MQRPSFTRTKARRDAESGCQGACRASSQASRAVKGPWNTALLRDSHQPQCWSTMRLLSEHAGSRGCSRLACPFSAHSARASLCWKGFGLRLLYPKRCLRDVEGLSVSSPWLSGVSADLHVALPVLCLWQKFWDAGASSTPELSEPALGFAG